MFCLTNDQKHYIFIGVMLVITLFITASSLAFAVK